MQDPDEIAKPLEIHQTNSLFGIDFGFNPDVSSCVLYLLSQHSILHVVGTVWLKMSNAACVFVGPCLLSSV